MKKVGGRLLALAVVVLGSVAFFLPSYQPLYKEVPRWLRAILPDKGITLGLDLQGGIHLVLEVEEERAVEIAIFQEMYGPHPFRLDSVDLLFIRRSSHNERNKPLFYQPIQNGHEQ